MFDLVPLVVLFPLVGMLYNIFFGRPSNAGIVASAASGASFVVAVLLMIGLSDEPAGSIVKFADWLAVGDFHMSWSFQVDTLSVTMMLIVTGVGTLIHVYSIGYMHGDSRFVRFFVYMNLFMAMMLILVSADNFVMMFVGWEGVGLCSFLLIGFWFDKSGDTGFANSAAAHKAFITNRIGDFGFLLAMLLMFREFDSLLFADVFHHTAELTKGGTTVTVITLLLVLGVTAKSAQIPLYIWLPDAMAGPTPASALIHAATMVTAGIYMITRSHELFARAPDTQQVIVLIGATTALLAATMAVGQFDIKRVLAYSTISQLGFMVAAVGMGAYVAGIFHLATHAFFKALLFLAAGSVIHGMEHHGDHKTDAQDMRNMGGLRDKMPTTFRVYLIGAVALMGIPPLAGFFSKDEILASASEENMLAYLLLSAAAFLTAFYMTRQLLMVFFGKARTKSADHAVESGQMMLRPMLGLAALAVIGGVLNLPGVHSLGHWLEHTLHEEEALEFNIVVAVVSTGLALLAIFLAYQLYGRVALKRKQDDPLRAVIGDLFTAINQKWWVDEAYAALVIDPFKQAAKWLGNSDWAIFRGFDRLMVRGSQEASDATRQTQTGELNWNVAGIVGGLVVLIIILTWRGTA